MHSKFGSRSNEPRAPEHPPIGFFPRLGKVAVPEELRRLASVQGGACNL